VAGKTNLWQIKSIKSNKFYLNRRWNVKRSWYGRSAISGFLAEGAALAGLGFLRPGPDYAEAEAARPPRPPLVF